MLLLLKASCISLFICDDPQRCDMILTIISVAVRRPRDETKRLTRTQQRPVRPSSDPVALDSRNQASIP